jgi:hypothetical protein
MAVAMQVGVVCHLAPSAESLNNKLTNENQGEWDTPQ